MSRAEFPIAVLCKASEALWPVIDGLRKVRDIAERTADGVELVSDGLSNAAFDLDQRLGGCTCGPVEACGDCLPMIQVRVHADTSDLTARLSDIDAAIRRQAQEDRAARRAGRVRA